MEVAGRRPGDRLGDGAEAVVVDLRPSRALPWSAVLGVAALAFLTGAASSEVSAALLALAVVLVTAKLGGHLAMRLGQPSVLGELVAGVIVGNLHLAGWTGLDWLRDDPFVALLAELGVILLLFQVGLESTLGQLARVGRSAAAVATVGVVVPMALGVGVGQWLLPQESLLAHLFLGAILTATSVGITARVLQDLGAGTSPEARVILGAAIIDDVLGLVILGGVTGAIQSAETGESWGAGPMVALVGSTFALLAGAALLGVFVVPAALRRLARLRGSGVMLGFTLAFCFALAWAAAAAGLAPIVGAFAAGLVLESAAYAPFRERETREIEDLIQPIVQFLAPVFFVRMGFGVELAAFAQEGVLLLAAALTVAAVVGKQACMLGVLDPGIRKLTVGIGMIPRGEVGLIFASVGTGLTYAGHPVVSPQVFSAIAIVVILTTLITPPLLTWSMRAPSDGAKQSPPPPAIAPPR